MKHLFIPYALALLAKEKGFDEPCLAWYQKSEILNHVGEIVLYMIGQPNNQQIYTTKDHELDNEDIAAPLYQQIIDWFRTKEVHIIIRPGFGYPAWYDWRIVSMKHVDIYASQDESYEQISDCYNKAIEEAFKLI